MTSPRSLLESLIQKLWGYPGLVDMAFRRHFAFIDVEPCLGETWREWMVTRLQMDLAATIEQRLGRLNAVIAADSRLGNAFQIGHSSDTQSLEGHSSRDWFAEVMASELKPLLQEDWFDAPEEAERQTAA
jgi:5-methylcytosine-specific restriction protein B